MSDRNDPARDEDQLGTISTGYRGLLATTRPLVIEHHTLPSWRGGEICRSGFGMLPDPGHWCAEFTLRRGEIFHSAESEAGSTEDEGRATECEDVAAEVISTGRQRDSNLQIRICLGMS